MIDCVTSFANRAVREKFTYRNLKYWLPGLLLVSLFIFLGLNIYGSGLPANQIPQGSKPVSILAQSYIWNDVSGKSNFAQAKQYFNRNSIGKQELNYKAPVHWLQFKLSQQYTSYDSVYLAIPFTDVVELYFSQDEKPYKKLVSGDLFPLPKRQVSNGQMVFFEIGLPQNKDVNVLLKLESKTGISQQFKELALNSIRVYTKQGFTERFEESRIYQAIFYGSLLIMMFYNLILSFSIASKSYSYYVVFLLLICVFLGSNSGYFFELFLPQHPRLDLYIRFISTPLLMLSYLFFSEQYLHIRSNLPKTYKIWQGFIALFCILLLVMISGFWKTGRTFTILASVVSFIFLFITSLNTGSNGN
ncbi:MAG: hypothetical protein EOP53_18495, partial [Sphingobacteriales bacterium]